MDLFSALILFGGLLILGCVLSSKLSSRWSMPGLLIFLLIGVLVRLLSLHDTVLYDVNSRLSWGLANHLGTIALCYILFSGGCESSLTEIKRVLVPGTVLSTVGVLLTAVLLGGICFLLRPLLGCLAGATLTTCLLFGAIISSTDAAAVFTILLAENVFLVFQFLYNPGNSRLVHIKHCSHIILTAALLVKKYQNHRKFSV